MVLCFGRADAGGRTLANARLRELAVLEDAWVVLMSDWLTDFVQYSSYGEASPRVMFWVGVSTVAAALRRKVWFDQEIFQWSPNFYILIVGAPGAIKKSTSIDIGMRLLKQAGIDKGPSIVTWQALIEKIAEARSEVTMPDGEVFEMSCMTLALSEFGSFFDPQNRELIDNLTDLWDGKLDTIIKVTKTSGTDEMVNSWINIIAATTPKWLAQNFGDNLVGGGLAGRFIYLYEDMPPPEKDVAYPKRKMGAMKERRKQESELVGTLRVIAEYAGDFELTEEAYEWGEAWYAEERKKLRLLGLESLDAGFAVRKQVHLHKLAMVVCAARLGFPTVEVSDMEEASRQLDAVDAGMSKVFGYVGQSKVTQASREIVEAVTRLGTVERRQLYRQQFFRTMTSGEFDEAVKSAIQAEFIMEQDGVARPVLMLRK